MKRKIMKRCQPKANNSSKPFRFTHARNANNARGITLFAAVVTQTYQLRQANRNSLFQSCTDRDPWGCQPGGPNTIRRAEACEHRDDPRTHVTHGRLACQRLSQMRDLGALTVTICTIPSRERTDRRAVHSLAWEPAANWSCCLPLRVG